MTFDQAFTLALAVLGAVLGILNTWHSFDQRRVRLRVEPSYAIPVSSDGKHLPPMFMIQAMNLSAFPVTVAEFGFEVGRRHAPVIIFQTLEERDRLPVRLDVHDAISFYFETGPMLALPRIGKAYVRTATGEYYRGSSPALRQLRDLLAESRAQRSRALTCNRCSNVARTCCSALSPMNWSSPRLWSSKSNAGKEPLFRNGR